MNTKRCACGCGEIIPTINTQHKTAMFKHGHNRKGRKAYPGEYDERRGSKAWGWKGGRIGHSKGYIMIHKPDHPQSNHMGYVMEHRLVWEEHHNAMLLKHAHVHHINEDLQDNRIDNLIACINGHHMKFHHLGSRHNKR